MKRKKFRLYQKKITKENYGNNTDNKKILKGCQKVVKTVWKMPQTRIKQGLPQILLRCHPYGNGDLFRY